jgi:hypothetical protein
MLQQKKKEREVAKKDADCSRIKEEKEKGSKKGRPISIRKIIRSVC